MDDLITPEERRRRHAAWLDGFGFSDRDRLRIRDFAEQVTPHLNPAALDDLSVPIRVGGCMADSVRHSNGDLLGVVQTRHGKVALLYWRMGNRELERWKRRPRG
ncbi:hypothetical protein [Phenylobacterium sp.]|uniref:hypothetical protein n=1 Tax=Phenylobacterium sp. TaxID=1871053 RepID=UPI00391DFE42